EQLIELVGPWKTVYIVHFNGET
nr:RecName: Full=Odorant-binding protein 1; AltName: Full=Odorant-binding protein I; Short=OBP-I [Oryctolagus cuniculus]